MTNDLDDAYRHCERISRASASSFFRSFRFLPCEQRRAMCALYAFSRLADDLADSDEPAETRRIQLARWRSELHDALRGEFRSPLWQALHDTTVRFAIPAEYLFALVDGVAMDLVPPRYETFDDLRHYCYHVASAVGLACIHVFGFEDDRAKALAETCGVAFQLTNILRDLSEDAEQGRIYLPREELARFDCQPEDFRQPAMNPRIRELLRFQIARAESLYDEATPLATLLHPHGRRAFTLMFTTYRTLLAEIKRREGDVFKRPIRLGFRGKLKVLVAAFLFHPRELAPASNETELRPHTPATLSRGRPAVRQSGS
ncbi:MAG: phytoene/squalene synthase family protein [Planctomycetota bacterium]|nr:phytoene/squalene synthase family protein [Planctomycetota bacterium]